VRRKRRKFHGPGKTRDEMVREARAAYQRREEELAQRTLDAVQGTKSGENRRERSWLEAMGLDGAMSTVHEERSNPMEDAEVFSQSSDDETDLTRIGTLPSREVSKEKEEVKEEPTEPTSKEVGETDGPNT
jgi:G protein-coupled receptor GPR1